MVKARIVYTDERGISKASRILRFRDMNEATAFANQYYPSWKMIWGCLPWHKRILYFFGNLIMGLKYGYPICCALHFGVDDLLCVPSGCIRYSKRVPWVECGWHIQVNGGVQPFSWK